VKALPRAEGVAEITVPGERGDRIFAECGRSGIPIPPAIWKSLEELAQHHGLAMPKTLGTLPEPVERRSP